jgi:hypothetical protein
MWRAYHRWIPLLDDRAVIDTYPRFAFRINIAVRGDLAPVLVKRQLVQQRGIH